MRCPSELELMRVIDAAPASADATALAAHVRACEACRDAVARFERAIVLARQLPIASPSAAHREEIRTAVLARGARGAARPPVHRSTRAGIAVALVAAIAAIVIGYVAITPATSSLPPAAVSSQARGTVVAHAGARFAATGRTPDEIVRLEDGVIDVEVQPLRSGERFRVVVGDAEVEVRGTAFEVSAVRDHLVAVTVHHGLVEVRPRDGAPALLAAGQSWRAQIARTPDPVPEPAPIIAPPSRPRPVSPPAPAVAEAESEPEPQPLPSSPPSRSPDEVAYGDAWTAMRAGAFDRAATAFARVFILAPDGSLAEDAGFWHAVALARAGRPGVAIGAFRDFLTLHPKAPRAGEASAMLGWLLLDARERDEAARRFHAAEHDPNPTVSTSARAGLEALAGTR